MTTEEVQLFEMETAASDELSNSCNYGKLLTQKLQYMNNIKKRPPRLLQRIKNESDFINEEKGK